MSIEKVKEYFAAYGREDDILEFDQIKCNSGISGSSGKCYTRKNS